MMMPFRHIYQPVVHLLVALFLGLFFHHATTDVEIPAASTRGAIIHYQLPTDGPLPRTYLVTLAVTDPKDRNWIVSNFGSGLVRTVTAQNQGRFTDAWNGLDENYMPVPPGVYGVKGIYLPAQKWAIDGQYHAVIPKLAATGGSWGQSPAQDSLPDKIEGDPVESPLGDVDVAANGKGSVAFVYLENGRNYFLTDFTRPIGYDQIITGYESGVFAGATSSCTDGEAIWSFSVDGGVKFIGRADGRPFGRQKANRDNVYIPDGWVTALAAWKSPDSTLVFDAERGRIVGSDYHESETEAVDRVRALDSRGATVLAQWNIARPLGLAARGSRLYILHGSGNDFEVLSLPLVTGWEKAHPTLLFKVPPGINPFDLEADSHGRVYLSDSAANHVYQFDARGRLLRTYGRLSAQPPGHYDPQSFMAPEKLACWMDSKGEDRLLVVEQEGPNRLSEWSGDSGQLLRQWVVPQTESNNGYAIDPHHPDLIYIQGQRSTLVRWKIDYSTGQWTTDAVWTHIGAGNFGGKLVQELASPRLIYRGHDVYLAYGRGYAVYHLEGDRWRACAALLADRNDDGVLCHYLWLDRNGDGQVQADEYRPYLTDTPPGILRYFGEAWFDDLSLVCIGQNTTDVWRLACTGLDHRGTPLYDPRGWRKLLSDDVFLARQAGRATALRGGNEVAANFNSDWASIVQGRSGELYLSARSGIDFTANHGAQYKLSRYVPDGKNGYRQSWRVGRMTIEGNAEPGQVYGPIFVSPPLNGLVGVIDNARAGVVLYTEDGLYVDTFFPDDHLVPHDQMGAYWQPGEYFAGSVYGNSDNGRIYFALGKTMPQIFEAQGWSLTQNPVHALTSIDQNVSLTAGDIAAPPDVALQMRGGAAAAHVARFHPSTGQASALDGSLRGWQNCEPVEFGNGAQTVEVRCLYDPDHLYLRWHARLGHDLEIKSLGLPQHLFAHDRAADTLGFYLQGDAHAAAGNVSPNGRPGDVRFVFGLFRESGSIHPAVLGMYPSWNGAGASPQTYRTPAGGTVTFAQVGLVSGAKAGYRLDADGRGFILAAALPRAAVPGSPPLEGWRTQGNFDANFGGQDKFWWSNADGSASRETLDEPSEARLYPGSWSMMEFETKRAK